MKPTSEVLERIKRNSGEHPDGVYTKIYRYLLREDIYLAAYQNLYANAGAATKGTDDDTADGFGKEYVEGIIGQLRNLEYRPKPVRRTYIPKQNGKMRPLGIPSFRDKLIQDAIRQILEAIYEPVFSDNSHGFRPGRSCHTAFRGIKYGFNGAKWFIEGDIKGCFDNINHKKLLEIISRKVKDSKLIDLIGAFLKAGYMEDWSYHQTYSGTPQGGILSPILANIYLSELDAKVEEIKKEFDTNGKPEFTDEYQNVRREIGRYHARIKRHPESPEAEQWKICKIAAENKIKTTPTYNPCNKRLSYVRYADDFLIGVVGSEKDCEKIKVKLKDFLMNELQLVLSDEKTKITHSSNKARFLGYDVSVRRSSEIKKRNDGVKQRTLNNRVELTIPLTDKIENFLILNSYGLREANGHIKPVAAKGLRNRSDVDIVSTYNSQMRGLCNFYHMAGNFAKLDYFAYIMEYSCLKTLASKHQTTMAQARADRRIGKKWGVTYSTTKGKKTLMFLNMQDLKDARQIVSSVKLDAIPKAVSTHSELVNRIMVGACELCGSTKGPFEVHHVAKLKELKGYKPWEQKMLSMRRKTLIACKDCHKLIHS